MFNQVTQDIFIFAYIKILDFLINKTQNIKFLISNYSKTFRFAPLILIKITSKVILKDNLNNVNIRLTFII